MKHIKVPAPIQLFDLSANPPKPIPGEEEPWSLHKFLLRAVLPDPAFGKGYKADRARVAIDKATRSFVGGEVWQIEDEHLDMLKTALETPGGEFPPAVKMQCFPFQLAIMEASDNGS